MARTFCTAPITDTRAAKYLDQIKGGRVPVEVLVRGKDAAENEKHFVKIAEIIKNAGVSRTATSVAGWPGYKR